jgi:hypothetical protein
MEIDVCESSFGSLPESDQVRSASVSPSTELFAAILRLESAIGTVLCPDLDKSELRLLPEVHPEFAVGDDLGDPGLIPHSHAAMPEVSLRMNCCTNPSGGLFLTTQI